MARYELSKVWIAENGERVKEAYSSAMARGYDIASVKDVLELLRVIDPENVSEENARALSGILLVFSRVLKQSIKRRYVPGQKPQRKTVN